MKHLNTLLITLVALLAFGCGSSDDFVFTNTNNNPTLTGVPSKLAFVTNPAQTVDTDFSVAPVVEVQDAFGIRVQAATTEITVSLVNPGSTILNGTTTRNAIDGRATFTGLSVSEAGTFTLQATGGGLTAGNSATFVVANRLALYALYSANSTGGPAVLSQFAEVNPADGSVVGISGFIGDGTTIGAVQDLVCLPNGSILGAARDSANNGNSYLIDINPSNPDLSTIIGVIDNGTTVSQIMDLAYDENHDILYGVGRGPNDRIFTINTSTGVGTPLPNDHGLNGQPASLAYDNQNNVLYMTSGNEELATVDVTTGVATVVGPLSSVDDIVGLDFNPETNVLFGGSRGDDGESSAASDFVTISTSTGNETKIGLTAEMTGLAFCAAAPIAPLTLPRQSSYTISNITEATVDISATGTDLNLGDDDLSDQPIGFTFDFNGTSFTTVTISSNGYLVFGSSFVDSCCPDELPPTAVLDDNTLLPLWDDLDPSIAGSVFVETLGTAPNRRFVIQWDGVAHHNGANPGIAGSFEVILFEGTNVFEFHYSDLTFGEIEHDNGRSAIVGVQYDLSTVDLLSIFAADIANNSAYRFTP